MYPVLRLVGQFIRHRRAAPLAPLATHVSQHRCLPWDLDLWMELNNGRTLTLYDLGRLVLARRVGLLAALKRRGWGLTMAGAVVRYRRRVRMFDRIEMRSRALCWDDRFVYLEQSMWVQGQCTSHVVYRAAIVDKAGIVAPARVLAEVAPGLPAPTIPDWIAAWRDAEAQRPWPPMQNGVT
jgi:acyl-CoA thioesterase FadM